MQARGIFRLTAIKRKKEKREAVTSETMVSLDRADAPFGLLSLPSLATSDTDERTETHSKDLGGL